MRVNKDKWAFYKLPNRPLLTSAEVLYWRNALAKILKVGIELEFNLPEKKTGSCKGDSDTCPCQNLLPQNDCWKKCINVNGCSVISERKLENCKNVTANCEAADCPSCEHFAGECTGIACPNFVSYCFVCPDYATECKSCPYRYDPEKNPDAIRKSLNDTLRPNNCYGLVAPSGVHSITQDGSLLGKKGAEIITVGRRVDYWEFFKMADNIFKEASDKGAYMNERCSIHMHVLASYYSKLVPSGMGEKMSIPERVSEMERDMPEIILANLHQLVRRYQNAMTWMMMGLDDPNHLTRWEKFRVSVLPHSAVVSTMREVMQQVSHGAGGNKYGWINYNSMGFNDSGDIRRFHVEMRACDGLMSPSAVAALACMYYALVIKAVEISRYGVVEIGDEAWLSRATKIKEALLNGTGDYKGSRLSDTSKLSQYYDVLVEESLDLVSQLKPILIRLGPAYDVLERLAERPCALRRIDGHTWDRIEEELKVIIDEEGLIENAVTEILVLNQVCDCQDEKEWIEAVGRILREDPELGIDPDDDTIEDTIKQFITNKKDGGELVWSNKIRAPIMI
jgi:hypothetical protein